MKEDNSELLLELPDLLAERRLRDLQPARRTPEMQVFCDRDEVAEAPEVELG